MTLDELINRYFDPVAQFFNKIVFAEVTIAHQGVPLIVLWLVAAGLFFTMYLRFINIRGFGHAVRVVRGVYEDPASVGQINHFQALTAALSGTVGLGNIAGVSIAISLGGPGAMVWMMLAGFLGMATKFTECTLGVKFRRTYVDGQITGGPMMYLSEGLKDMGLPRLGRILSVIFAIACIGGTIGATSLFQTNQSYVQLMTMPALQETFLADHAWVFGLFMAALVGVVIIGGINSIARVTEKLVPFMCGLLILASLVILAVHFKRIPAAISLIFTSAFDWQAAGGGMLGALIMGFRRAAFSNEAGLGSAAIAHSAVKTDEPVDEGYVALLEPFIDTVVLCTLTALVIIVSGAYEAADGISGVELASSAFASVLPWFPMVLAVCVFMFAYSSIISWSYYAIRSMDYLSNHHKYWDWVVKFILLFFTAIGASTDLHAIVAFADAMVFTMAVPNIIGLYLLAPVVKRELQQYEARLAGGQLQRFK